MRINRWLIFAGAATLQIASWFDFRGWLDSYIPMNDLTPMQSAQLVGSGVLALIFFAIREPATKESK